MYLRRQHRICETSLGGALHSKAFPVALKFPQVHTYVSTGRNAQRQSPRISVDRSKPERTPNPTDGQPAGWPKQRPPPLLSPLTSLMLFSMVASSSAAGRCFFDPSSDTIPTQLHARNLDVWHPAPLHVCRRTQRVTVYGVRCAVCARACTTARGGRTQASLNSSTKTWLSVHYNN